jgi:hypothetical protein
MPDTTVNRVQHPSTWQTFTAAYYVNYCVEIKVHTRDYASPVQARLDHHPEKMTMRRQTAEHPFGTIKDWMGATHFLTKRLPKVATEMALNVLAYNIKRMMVLIGVAGLLEALST